MSSTRRLLFLTGTALVVGYSTAAAETLKCSSAQWPGYDRSEPRVLVDGKISDFKLGEPLPSELGTVASLEIRCWDPKSGDFVSTAESGVPVIMILTEEFVASAETMAGLMVEARKAMQEWWDSPRGSSSHDRREEVF